MEHFALYLREFWNQGIETALARDLDHRLENELNLTSKTKFLVVYTNLSKSIYELVDGHSEIFQVKKGRFIDYLHKRAKTYYENLSRFIIFRRYFNRPFDLKWDYSIKLRQSAGVILRNNNDEVLFVIQKNNSINFPMGHEDPNDERSLETTAYRELEEETGYQRSDRIILNDFVDSPFSFKSSPRDNLEGYRYRMNKIQRIYYYPNFVHVHEIRQDYDDDYEINGNVWVKIRSLQNFFAGARMYRNYQPNDKVNFTYNRLNVVPYQRGFTVAPSVQNFFIRPSDLRNRVLQL